VLGKPNLRKGQAVLHVGIIQEEPEAPASNNQEVISHIADKVVLLDDLDVTTSGRVQPENLEDSTEVSNSQVQIVVRTSRRQKKPPAKEDFVW
jgi:aspartate carbamoyltransferase catalytic subunit